MATYCSQLLEFFNACTQVVSISGRTGVSLFLILIALGMWHNFMKGLGDL